MSAPEGDGHTYECQSCGAVSEGAPNHPGGICPDVEPERDRVAEIVALLVEERVAQNAEARRLDALVAARMDALGEAAQRDPLTLAINAQCDVAISRVYACRKALRLLGEQYPV